MGTKAGEKVTQTQPVHEDFSEVLQFFLGYNVQNFQLNGKKKKTIEEGISSSGISSSKRHGIIQTHLMSAND